MPLSTQSKYIEPHIGRLTQGGSYSGQFIHGAGGRKAIAWCVTLTCSGVRQLETPTYIRMRKGPIHCVFLDKEMLCMLGLECIFVEGSFRHPFTRKPFF